MFPEIQNNALPLVPRQGMLEQNRELVPIAQADQQIQEVDERILQMVFELGLKMGEGVQTLRLEKLQLETEKRKLEGEMTQLKLIHLSELNQAVDGLKAQNDILTEKVKNVAEMLTLFIKTYPNAGFPSNEALCFALLPSVIGSRNYEGLRKVPEYKDYRKKEPATQVIAAKENALILRQNLPVIQDLTKKILEESDSLKAENQALNMVNLALMDKQEAMTDYIQRFIKEMKRQEREFRYLKILKEVQSVYDRINWELPQGCQESLKKIQEAVKSIISTLEEFTKDN